VADCAGTNSAVQLVQSPAQLVDAGNAQVTPVVYGFAALARTRNGLGNWFFWQLVRTVESRLRAR